MADVGRARVVSNIRSVSHDVIVLGLGGMGSAAAYHLARRGQRVVGFDRFPPAHDRGSSHGRSRIIREAYFEHPSYVPLVQRAYELWRDLGRVSGQPLLLMTGGINIGSADGELVSGALASVRQHHLQHEVLDAATIRRRFPVFSPADDMIGVYEPTAGVLFPEECVGAHLHQAADAGAELHHEEPVQEWSATPDHVEVRTARGRYEASRLIVTAGPWAPQVLADLGLPLVIERQVVAWFHPVHLTDAFEPGRCPVHIWQVDRRLFYGFPQLGPDGVKVAEHATGHPTTADTIRRQIAPEEIDDLRRVFVEPCVPAANGVLAATSTCMYTMTPDAHFIVDAHPRYSNVLIAGGFSGHGFKFAAVIGEIVAELVLDGRTRHDISFFAAPRFAHV